MADRLFLWVISLCLNPEKTALDGNTDGKGMPKSAIYPKKCKKRSEIPYFLMKGTSGLEFIRYICSAK